MADAPDLGSGGAILRGSSPLPGSLSDLTAVFKQKQFGGSIGKIEANRAIATAQVARDAATGAHAVDLVNADVAPQVELAPRFDKQSALRVVGEQTFEGRAFVFEVNDRRCCFEALIVQTGRLE